MARKAIVTVAAGAEYQILANLLNPSKKAYAKKTGADFVEITNRVYPQYHGNFEKLQAGKILEDYDKILLLDCDTLIRKDTPDLFTLVPDGNFAAYNTTWWGGRAELAPNYFTDLRAPQYGVERVSVTHYFNSGVMLVPKSHKVIFDPPPNMNLTHPPICHVDQPWINMQLFKYKLPFIELPYTFNKTHTQKFGRRTDAFIIHYDGMKLDSDILKYGENPLETIKHDMAIWKSQGLLGEST